jgi:iron complex outermembrane receptor protein
MTKETFLGVARRSTLLALAAAAGISTNPAVHAMDAPLAASADDATTGMAAAYTHGKYTEPTVSVYGQSLTFSTFPDTPDWSGSVYVKVDLPLPSQTGATSMRVDAYAQTSQWFTSLGSSLSPGTELPHYSVINMRYDWQKIFQSRLSLGLFVRNLQNKEYFQGGFANGPSAGVNVASPAPPRMYGGEINYAF